MNPPLLEILLQLHFEPIELTSDRLQYFYRMNNDLLPETKAADEPNVACYLSMDRLDCLTISPECAELHSKRGVSFPTLRSSWARLLGSLLRIFSVSVLKQISLAYFNEIPIDDLRTFRTYMNIGIEMPAALRERVEFFRSEFTYKYDFGEIKVWLQPDWNDQMQNYCIQLNLESRQLGPLEPEQLIAKIQQLHEGIKDVFRQILSEDYIRSLPQ